MTLIPGSVLLFISWSCLATPSLALGLGKLLGLKPTSSGSSNNNNNMILCTIRHSIHYATVYDTVLVDKCVPSSSSCQGSSSGGSTCQTVMEKECSSKIETVYENQCTTEKDQSCSTVYDTTYEDKCETDYVRICGGFQPVQSAHGQVPTFNGIHRSMDVDTDSLENDTLNLQQSLNVVRKRRSPYQGQGGCTKIPQQKCKKIPRKEPRRQCNTVDKPSCQSTPRQVHKQECKDVPRQQCQQQQQQQQCGNGSLQKCHKVQRKVPRLVGHKVPHKHCETLNANTANQGIRLVGVFNSPGASPSSSYAPSHQSYNAFGPSSTIVHPTGYF